jgi:hypothetical protein
MKRPAPRINNACSESYGEPVIDAALTGVWIAVSAAVSADDDSEHGPDPMKGIIRSVFVGVAAGQAVSAGYGLMTANQCRARKRATREALDALARATRGDCRGFEGLQISLLANQDRALLRAHPVVEQCRTRVFE